MVYQIKPIKFDEWLPDRCMKSVELLDPSSVAPEAGCHSLNGFYTKESRSKLVHLYKEVLENVGCCGFIAWQNQKIIGYNNFFPSDIANEIKFYGWGYEKTKPSRTLVHHCISLINNQKYRRKGIGSDLIRHSLDWAKRHQWRRFEVHLVLPDTESGFNQEQKSCVTFWKKFGFEVFREQDSNQETIEFYGIHKRYSMAIDLI